MRQAAFAGCQQVCLARFQCILYMTACLSLAVAVAARPSICTLFKSVLEDSHQSVSSCCFVVQGCRSGIRSHKQMTHVQEITDRSNVEAVLAYLE